jgi:NAD(P)-dependent dehydrogenase (short-subunit alcohol dehydrogenase family)
VNPPLRDWGDQVVWIIGASSGIGRATAARLHALGAQVVVSARTAPALQAFTADHPGAVSMPLDVTDPGALRAAAAELQARQGRIDLVMYCAGIYHPQRATAFDLAAHRQHLAVNYVGALQLLDAVLPILLAQGHGHLSLVGSVAGYRGLPQALAYGPTKAALINLAEVLYLDLHPQGLGVSLINPGFVETPLTAQNAFHMPALITPEAAANAILAGWRRGRFEIHFPWRFTMWLKALRLLTYGPYFAAVRRSTGL